MNWDSIDDLNRIPARMKEKLAVLQWGGIGKLIGSVSALYIDLLEENLLTQPDK